MNKVIDMLLNHRSIRKYSDREVTDDMVKEIIASAQMAPTSSHFQAYTIIEIRDKKEKQLRKYLGGNLGL